MGATKPCQHSRKLCLTNSKTPIRRVRRWRSCSGVRAAANSTRVSSRRCCGMRCDLSWRMSTCISNVSIVKNYSRLELKVTQHLTLAGADAKIAEYQELLADIEKNYDGLYSKYLEGNIWHSCAPLPKDWALRVDKYLERGDIIQCKIFLGHHVGIYLGNGKVAHMSGHHAGKTAAKARVGELIPDFVNDAKSTLQVSVLWVRARTKEQIAHIAERYAADGFREREYNFLVRNCQHFVTLCALGTERLLEISF